MAGGKGNLLQAGNHPKPNKNQHVTTGLWQWQIEHQLIADKNDRADTIIPDGTCYRAFMLSDTAQHNQHQDPKIVASTA